MKKLEINGKKGTAMLYFNQIFIIPSYLERDHFYAVYFVGQGGSNSLDCLANKWRFNKS